ncbi:UNVERIFIED_CONTAM: DUF4440 domain-containing protein [Halobacillus marinus]
METALEKHLYQLETKLLEGEVRKSATSLNELLADDFLEFSSTGKAYGKEHVLKRLPGEDDPGFQLDDFHCTPLSPERAMTSFRIYIQKTDKHSLRTSVWKRTDGKWQMTFHQGTMIGD